MKAQAFNLLFAFVVLLFQSSVALSLESYSSFRTNHADEARRVQPTAIVVKGTTDDVLYYLEADPTTGAIPVSTTIPTRTIPEIIRNDYSSVNVTTGAYVELVASTSDTINRLHIFDSCGETLVIATGAAASEVDLAYVAPGGDAFDVTIASGTRISIKAISANCTTGEIVINAIK